MAQFDYEKFEKLTGLELGKYCISPDRDSELNDEFVEYFEKKQHYLDDQHLEYCIVFFGKIKSQKAYHLISDFLNYPITYVRFPAIKILTNYEDYDRIPEEILNDRYIIEKAKQALKDSGKSFVVEELKNLVERSKIKLEE
jgi:hypothetical protein